MNHSPGQPQGIALTAKILKLFLSRTQVKFKPGYGMLKVSIKFYQGKKP
jgi:hypothetical protein